MAKARSATCARTRRAPAGPVDLDDAALRRGIRDGTKGAWDRLFLARDGALRARASRVLGPGADADEVVDETWRRAFAAAGAYDPARPPGPWLSTFCARLCVDLLRSRRSRREEPLGADPPGPAQPDREDVESRRRSVRAAVERLPPPQREATIVCWFFEQPVGEAAAILRTTAKGVRRRLDRAYLGLRRILAGQFGPGADGPIHPR